MNQIEAYIKAIDPKWQAVYSELLEILKEQVPAEFELAWQYEMPTFIVPLSVFPEGYLGRKDEGLPFISLAAQKKHLSLYHMGLMGNKELLNWFQEEYKKQMPTKLNMGKSCIRLTNPKTIPFELLGELASRMSMDEWIGQYERFAVKRNSTS
ncbi:DUF1801 domain-containing protein [Enterococcus sp. BWR-S5]|uniref:DUF1801 domain-containing protein n=1 Tax=Enterococcus sp. BWR-S5 TaxID=2787714 RepID=UPI00192453E5|nr:DUF1801 domain-containing protein [Enterococcus sp. BWR-S5]MBL1227525.1 DUF1801 domain-containing protein [Enterococcus sp. BWR-S5]